MTRQNYKAECYAMMAYLTRTPEFHAMNWQFNEYKPGNTCLVKIIEDDTQYEPFGDRYRTWQELSHYMRGYMQGFWHGVKCGLKAEQTRRICIEVKTAPNRSGNSSRLYLEFNAEGYRVGVHEEYSKFLEIHRRISDTLTISTSEFREYARIAKVCKEAK